MPSNSAYMGFTLRAKCILIGKLVINCTSFFLVWHSVLWGQNGCFVWDIKPINRIFVLYAAYLKELCWSAICILYLSFYALYSLICAEHNTTRSDSLIILTVYLKGILKTSHTLQLYKLKLKQWETISPDAGRINEGPSHFQRRCLKTFKDNKNKISSL